MQILVTGCCGLIGSWITKGLMQSGYNVIGIDNLSGGDLSNLPRRPDPQFKFFQTDLTDYLSMKEIFMAQRPEVIYHLAAIAREGASEFMPRLVTATNIMASATVLELGIQYGMKRFIFTSSMSVYGSQEPPFSENILRKPVDPYGVNKAATEHIIEQLSDTHGFEYIILRPHNVFGPGASLNDPYRGVVGIFMNRIMRKEPIYIYGEKHVRAFSYIEDCLPSMLKCMTAKKAKGEIINIGGIETITVDDLAEEIIKCFPEYPRPEIVQLPPRPHEVASAWYTTEKSVKVLWHDEKIDWVEGIKRTAEWAKKIGPSKWKVDNLPLLNDKAPKPWLDLANN